MMPSLLVVEDDRTTQELIKLTLHNRDFEIETAETGEEALDVVTAQPPDLILLDLMMHGISGEDLLEHLMQNPHTRHIPIVILTAYTSGSLNERDYWLERGAVDFIVQPFIPADLISRINAAIAQD
ncbi:MAG: two-component system response regulator [Anaerolineae bacterium]